MNAPVGSLLLTLSLYPAPQDPPRAAPTPPARIEWQRSLPDALAVQKETGLPLLVVVNMDGENFNEQFAGRVYVEPAFVESTRGYVCIVASPDRHTTRDYDALGRRVECPRFPGCTCSEHINIEPELFTRYFNGTRNAPRHVGVSKEGKILFDRFLDAAMETAIDAIAQHRGKPKDKPPGDTLDELLTRRDAKARRALEQMYEKGDQAQKRKILAAAATAKNEPFDLLRIALRDEDPAIFGAAAAALAAVATKDALIDLEDALARTDDAALAKALQTRLGDIGQTDKGARRLHAHFAEKSDARFSVPWRNEWTPAAFDASSRESIEAVLDQCEAKLRATPDDDGVRLLMATAQAAGGCLLATSGAKGVELWFEDAQRSAGKVKAQPLQAEAKAVTAIAAWMRGEGDAAQRALAVALGTANSDRKPDAWLASTVLDVVVQTTAGAAYAKATADATANLGPELERTRLALQLQTEHNGGGEAASLVGIGLFEHVGLRAKARQYFEALVKRFPTSPAVHERWRNRLFVDFGAEATRKWYAQFAASAKDPASAQWFAGYASLVAGEQHTRDERNALAMKAYTDAIERFAKSAAANPDFVDNSNHFAVLSYGGRAVLRQAAGDGAGAVDDLMRAAELRPASLDENDGLQRKPRAIAGRVARELTQQGKTELAEKLKPIVL
ncbi:MAG TPA: hypothetical protein VFD82_09680 [Planctomycetota bacterium]|nr:hypothetical protein [Planctomycetota bacterium]